MPAASRWLVRAALAHLVAGFGIGALLLADRGLGFAPWARPLVGVHVEIVIVGWMLQLAMGVATWILPRRADRASRHVTAWVALVLVNAGVAAVVASALGAGSASWAMQGRVAEFAGAIVFAVGVAGRVRPPSELASVVR